MILTMQTEGADSFRFDLKQTDVIYLLNYAQEHVYRNNIDELQKTLETYGAEEKDCIPESAQEPEEKRQNRQITADGKYSGFLLIRCSDCGQLKGFCTKVPIDTYKCSECGADTPLADLKPLYMDCECGKHYKYMTNETADMITHPCISCGTKNDMKLNSRGTAYISVSPYVPARRGVRTIGLRW